MQPTRRQTEPVNSRSQSAYTKRTMYTRFHGVGASVDGMRTKKTLTATKPQKIKKSPVYSKPVKHQKKTKSLNQLPRNNVIDDFYVPAAKKKQHPKLAQNKPSSLTAEHVGGKNKSKATTKKSTNNKQHKTFFSNPKEVIRGAIKARFNKSKQYYLTVSAAVLIFIFGIGVSIHTLLLNRQAKEQVAVLASSSGSSEEAGEELTQGGVPNEDDPDPDWLYNHIVAPDKPRFIRVSKIGVEARVIEVGVNENNQLGAPASIFDAGWYRNSAKPGQDGAVLIDGHVSGPNRPGVFKELKSLNAGDKIEIERGDGKVISYEVVTKKSYPYEETDMAAALKSVEPGKNGLNLITCDGRFNAADNNYEDRLIVFAVQL